MPITYEQKRDAVIVAVWERWTKNGLALDEEALLQTGKSVDDAVNDAWQHGMTTDEWQLAALAHLGAGHE